LGKALNKLAAPEPPPAGIAGFQIQFPLQSGNQAYAPVVPALHADYPILVRHDWPVSVDSALGTQFRATPGIDFASGTPALAPPAAEWHPASPRIELPPFALASIDGIEHVSPPVVVKDPALCGRWMRLPDAQAVECWIAPRCADAQPAVLESRAPQVWDGMGRTAALKVSASYENCLPAPAPQAAECLVIPTTADALPAALAIRLPIADLTGSAAVLTLDACPGWMGAPQAQAAERWVAPLSADALAAALELRLPQVAMLSIADEPAAPTAPAACESWMPAPQAQAAERWVAPLSADVLAAAFGLRLPQATALSIAVERQPAAPAAPALCESWMPLRQAQAAECWVAYQTADALASASRVSLPEVGALSIAAPYVARVSKPSRRLQPEPAAVGVFARMDDAQALHSSVPALPAFDLLPAEEPALTQAAEPEPEMAGLLPGLVASPVESMPLVPPFAAVAIAPLPAVQLPEVGNLLRRPLTLARFVKGPAAMPVESMPTVAAVQPMPVVSRASLRRPTLAHFQLVRESSAGLAAPMAPAAPEAAEAMPSRDAFAAQPAAASIPPAMLETRIETTSAKLAPTGFQEGSSPRAEAPQAQLDSRKPSLDPITRIAAQPSGAQPERPKPAIPLPGIFALEYHCQRVTAKPACRPAWIDPRIAVAMTPFPVAPALKRFEEYGGASKRKILPIEEIFAHNRRNQARRRVNLSHAGKIAASVMVALALWAGSRIAGVAQHTQALRVQVASPDRSVVVANARQSQPQGNGPVAKIRRAIADRAAMEITDTFAGGMTAWGAEGKKFAAGWSHHADGYVKTGEMALFKPSLTYTDYRMEFYGQIEEKSMGWVVRAKDKKNYYAMKFKIVEPGLRPMIAMVHYQVVNGKPGRATQTPLSVMVHNNEPYHVSVDVRGNHFVAAIEGEPVESWTDDAPARGGVGFFSDAGERARLYWMKLSRNQDWLGRMCAYLSGDGNAGPAQTAELWRPELPGPRPVPVDPRVPERALPVRGLGPHRFESPLRASISDNRRSAGWTS
jgi:hypothetical protein